MVHGLGWAQPGNRRQDTKGIGGEKNHRLGMSPNSRNDRTRNKLNRVGDPRILCDFRAIVVHLSGLPVKSDIFNHRTKTNGLPDLGFILGRKLDALSVAASFKIKDAGI